MHLTGFVPVSPTRPVGHCWLPAVTLTVAAKVGMLLTLTVLILHFVPPLFLVDATDHCILVGCLLHASMQKYVSIKMVQRNNYMEQSLFWNGESSEVSTNSGLLWAWRLFYQCVHKTMLPLDLILSQFNPAHTLTVLIFSILSSMLKALEWSFLRFPDS